MNKILLGGCPFGSENIGDDAILSSLMNSFSSPNNKLTISIKEYNSHNTNYIYPYIASKGFNINILYNKHYSNPIFGMLFNSRRNIVKAYFNNLKDIQAISHSDLVIIGGGTLISDLPWHLIKILSITRKQNIPTIIFGIGMTEKNDYNALKKIRKEFEQLDHIYVRDSFVKDRLLNIGLNEQKIKISYDPAITLNGSGSENLDKFIGNTELFKRFNNNNINIAISLSSEKDVVGKTDLNKIQFTIDHLVKKYNADIFLIPTNLRLDADIKLMEILKKNLKVHLIRERFKPEDLIEFLKKFKLVISSRLHLNIFSSIAGTPFVGLIRNSKISDYSNLHNLKSFNFSEINTKHFFEYLEQLIDTRKEISECLTDKIKFMRKTHISCIKEIKQLYLNAK